MTLTTIFIIMCIFYFVLWFFDSFFKVCYLIKPLCLQTNVAAVKLCNSNNNKTSYFYYRVVCITPTLLS